MTVFHFQVSDRLGTENVKALKNLCYDFIPTTQHDNITSGLEVFNALIEKSEYFLLMNGCSF